MASIRVVQKKPRQSQNGVLLGPTGKKVTGFSGVMKKAQAHMHPGRIPESDLSLEANRVSSQLNGALTRGSVATADGYRSRKGLI